MITYWHIVLVVFKILIPSKQDCRFSQANVYYYEATKKKPRVIHRQYKNFRNDYFRIVLENALLKYDINSIDYDNFIKTFLTVLDKHDPIKKKYLRVNHANLVAKQLRKAIMKRSKLRNDFLKDRNDASQNTYRKQRNFCKKPKNSISRI